MKASNLKKGVKINTTLKLDVVGTLVSIIIEKRTTDSLLYARKTLAERQKFVQCIVTYTGINFIGQNWERILIPVNTII